jgi:hypothetical protein
VRRRSGIFGQESFFFGAAPRFVVAIRYTDHKKFNVETDSTIELPAAQPDRDQPLR